MKPLELHIYEKHPDADAYRVGGFYSPYCLVSTDKRFSEAELAAEYWHAEKDLGDIRGLGGRYLELEPLMLERVLTVHRFATLPHYDEADQ